MNFRGCAAAIALSVLLLPGVASAEEQATATEGAPAAEAATEAETPASPWGTFSATITGVTDYRDRGVSQTDDSPAIQGSIDWEHDSGFYLGVWASNVDFNDGGQADYELDVYGGYTAEWGGFDWDFMVNGIFYPGAAEMLDYDLVEFSTIVERSFGIVNARVKLFYSPDNFADSGPALYSRMEGDVPIFDTGLSLTGAFGHQYIDNKINYGFGSYNDWSVGLAYSWQGFDFKLDYIDNDLNNYQCNAGCDATAMFSVSRTFGGAEE